MIYFKAICRIHGWESDLYVNRGAAIKKARLHRANTQEPHDMVILEIYIPKNNLDVRSEVSI